MNCGTVEDMMAQDVFISYSRIDLAFVERLDAFLTDIGISTWFDKKSLLPGQKWEDMIEDEIPRSTTFLVCLSKAAMDKTGYFYVEQHLASEAALRIPPERLYVLPTLLGDCEVPRKLKQYQAVNLAEPGSIEMLLTSLSSALNRQLIADPEAVGRLRNELIGHLGTEGASNHDFVNRFMRTEEISFQDSVGIIERIANSNDPSRLKILLELRVVDFLSYAEQAALDIAIDNVKAGNRTENIQNTVRDNEQGRIAQMGIPGNAEATQLLQINKYVRYVTRKGTQPYQMAEDKIRNLVAGQDDLPADNFPLQIALNLGFRCAKAFRSKNIDAFDDVPDTNLTKVGLTRTALICAGTPREWLNGVKATLAEEGREVAFWFSLGFWCYGVTWVFAEKGENLELELGRRLVTEDVQRLLREDGEVRKALSNFLGAMNDAGWSPDDAEKFGLEKIGPFLWDPEHRKWAHRPDMGPMQDLAFRARK